MMGETEAPAPTDGEVDAGAPEARDRESLAGVLGVGLGLLLLALCVLTLVGSGPRPLAAAGALEDSFQVGELPEGLTLEPAALRLPAGEEVVTISNGAPVAIDPKEVVMQSSTGGGGRGGFGGGGPRGGGMGGGPGEAEVEPYDWAGIETLAEDSLPARVYLVRFPEKRAPSVLTRQFRGLQWRDLREIGEKGGTAVVGGGKVEWAGYGADFVRERRFLVGGSFRDTIRVNLSLGRRCWIAYAIWPEQHRGSEEVVRQVLDAFRPI